MPGRSFCFCFSLPCQLPWIVIIEVTVDDGGTDNGRDSECNKLRRYHGSGIETLHCSIEVFDLHNSSEDEDNNEDVRYRITMDIVRMSECATSSRALVLREEFVQCEIKQRRKTLGGKYGISAYIIVRDQTSL